MLLTFLLPIWNFLKPYRKYLIIGVLVIGCFLYFRSLYNENIQLKADNNRKSENEKNMNFNFATTKLKNGQMQYDIKVLTLKNNELQNFNSKVDEALKQMDLNIKNIQSVTNVSYHYTTNIDSIPSKQIVSNNKNVDQYSVDYDKHKIKVTGNINIDKDRTKNPFLTDLQFKLNDTLLIVPEIIYKRSWIFWKKPTGVKNHIKSENPDFVLDMFQTYQFEK